MSLYNLVNGYDAMAPALLAILRLAPGDIPRFRDCWWNGEHIVVYTRTGGGNRDYYESEARCRTSYADHFDGSRPFPDGPWNEDLRKLPTYVRDEDDGFDSTYAMFYYTVPDNFGWAIPQLIVQSKTPKERLDEFLAKMDNPNDPQVKRVMQSMEPLMQQIGEFLHKGQEL